MKLNNKLTKITFHKGVLTIGGTIIEVAYKDSHVFFDFGSVYNPALKKQPTDLQGYLDLSLIPFVNHLYDPSIPLKGYVSKPQTFKHRAVFLSHMHLDHSKVINYLHPEIPLYTLNGTKSLLETLNINNDFLAAKEPMQNIDGFTRKIIGVEEMSRKQIGDISVTLIPVDHDAYGACGLKIETPDMTIAYTGDLRLHGYRQQATELFCEETKQCDVLIIEGVSVSFKDLYDTMLPHEKLSEKDVINQINQLTRDNPTKQLTFNYYISNIERVYELIQTNSRQVVLDSYYAYVLKQATGYQALYYVRDGRNYDLDPTSEIQFETLLEDQGTYLFQLSESVLPFVSQLKSEGIYIHSNAVPLFEKDPSYHPFMDAFAKVGVEVKKIACSGHAHPHDLMKIINKIQPKLLVPIHSLHPERLTNAHGKRLLPRNKQTI